MLPKALSLSPKDEHYHRADGDDTTIPEKFHHNLVLWKVPPLTQKDEHHPHQDTKNTIKTIPAKDHH